MLRDLYLSKLFLKKKCAHLYLHSRDLPTAFAPGRGLGQEEDGSFLL